MSATDSASEIHESAAAAAAQPESDSQSPADPSAAVIDSSAASSSAPRRKTCPVCQTQLAINTKYCSCGHTFTSGIPSFARPPPSMNFSSMPQKRPHDDSAPVPMDRNDDVCAVCKDRGRLLCCDRCELAFHPDCAGLERIPDGLWLCPKCEMEQNGHGEGKEKALSMALQRELGAFDLAQKKLFDSLDPEQAKTEEIDGFVLTAFPPPGVKIEKKDSEENGNEKETQSGNAS
jgi:hypothetical protein